ncbi:MAG: glycine cleavage system protein GcvH [Anaerolineae bacterium]|jgi:glycine cleavage system H protein|nr:glycine cleavage system protein GcvH [Anaerolineae bacterium]
MTEKYPQDLRYTKTDEWVRVEGDTATLGITYYAQDALNDLVFFEAMAAKGEAVAVGDQLATVESVKAVGEVMSPVAGTVAEVNTALPDSPEHINQAPYGKGWMLKITLTGSIEDYGLMTAAEYEAYCAER